MEDVSPRGEQPFPVPKEAMMCLQKARQLGALSVSNSATCLTFMFLSESEGMFIPENSLPVLRIRGQR